MLIIKRDITSLFLFKDHMRLFVVLLALLSCSLVSANSPANDERGRALANYQVCRHIALDINDEQMFSYYQKMYNDALFLTVSGHEVDAKQVYDTWESAEKILQKLGKQHLQTLCLRRFEPLARKMLKK